MLSLGSAPAPQVENTAEEDYAEVTPVKRKKASKEHRGSKEKSKRSSKRLKGEED